MIILQWNTNTCLHIWNTTIDISYQTPEVEQVFLRDRLISFHKTVTGLDRLKLKIDGSNDQNGLNLARCGHSRFARLVYFEMKQAKMWTLV